MEIISFVMLLRVYVYWFVLLRESVIYKRETTLWFYFYDERERHFVTSLLLQVNKWQFPDKNEVELLFIILVKYLFPNFNIYISCETLSFHLVI